MVGPLADLIVSVSPIGVVTSHGQDLSAVLLSQPALQAEYVHDEEAIAQEAEIELTEKPDEKVKAKGGNPCDLAHDIHDCEAQFIHRDKPFIDEAEDQLCFAAPADRIAVLVGLGAIQEALLLQILRDHLPNL